MTEILFVSDRQYDYRSLIKVAQANGYLGNIRVHTVKDGYIITFPDCIDGAKEIFHQRLEDLTRNIWSH